MKKKLCLFVLGIVEGINPSLLPISVLFSTLLITLIGFNLSGLTPLCFVGTAHPGMIFPIALTLFFSGLIVGVSKNTKAFVSHFLPEGSPLLMSGFLVGVEMVSVVIRPITLSIRLFANMMTGHLFVEMLTSCFSSAIFLIPGVIATSGILLFETFVCFIQAFVFTNLLIMFFSENPNMALMSR